DIVECQGVFGNAQHAGTVVGSEMKPLIIGSGGLRVNRINPCL
ncbi:hypothetical protein MNBD_GAMMA14-2277, partial [hydrothermal vent metagenome]